MAEPLHRPLPLVGARHTKVHRGPGHRAGGDHVLALGSLAKVRIQSLQIILPISNVMTMELSRKGYAILMTTHNPNHPLLLHCQTWLTTAGGHITAGNADEIITNRSLSDLYDTSVVVEHLEVPGRNVCFVKL